MPAAVRDITSAKKPQTAADDPPELVVKIPKAPTSLAPDEAEVFNSMAKLLAGMRVMSDSGVDALAVYSRNWVEALKAHEQVRELGAIIPSPKGYLMVNPHLGVRRKAEEVCLKIMTEFGLTPSAMNRVNKITP